MKYSAHQRARTPTGLLLATARTQDLSPADVVTIYMTPYAMQKLRPRLEKFLRDGTRLVMCVDELPGGKPTQSISVTAENKRTYEIRLYVFARRGGWTSFSKFGKSP